MHGPTNPPSDERDETDESLRIERSRTDEELAASRLAIEEDADTVVQLARDRAGELLRKSRERADKDLAARGANASVREDIVRERLEEDAVLALERAATDEQLHDEREERQGVLARLLRHERDQTDAKLSRERAAADERVAHRDEFLGMVSHDLRTHLATIALNAGMLARDASRPEADRDAARRRLAENIRHSVGRMSGLLGDLLDVVSIDAGKLAVAPRPHNAGQLAREALDTFQSAFSAQGLTLDLSVEAGALLANLDPQRILQVLANLLGNALKFTHVGGASLRVGALGPDIRFSVIDTGVGIPADQVEQVFERFRQVKPKDRRGLGLGLYIARSIVEAHGGRIWAERCEAGGTAMHFTVPRATAAPGE